MPFQLSKLASNTIPRHTTTLSVSWLNNQFRAVAVHRGQVAGCWECPESRNASDKLEEFIRDAIRETGYQGQTLSLVLTHPRLVQQMVDVPPVKGQALNKVIQRQAVQQKFFPGEAAYASQMLVSAKNTCRIVLHLFPRLMLNQFMLACRRNDLHLVSAVPASAVLQRQLAALSPQKNDVVMLAAETGGSTTVVICDGDGRLYLARSLQGSWNDDAPKLALDLNRTILYVSQQFNVTLNRGVYLFGAGAAEQAPVIQSQLKLKVQASPVPLDPFYWTTESLKLRSDLAPNFQSPELQKAPQRRAFARIVAASAAVLLVGSVAVTSYSLVQSRRDRATIASFGQQITHIEARQKELDQVDAELQRKQQAIRLVLGDRPPPKPAWLLAYLGQVVPAEIVVTNFSVKREADYYRVKLAGTRQAAAATPTGQTLADSVEDLKAALAGSPFHMRILETDAAGKIAGNSREQEKAAAPRVPLAEWLNRVASSVRGNKSPGAARRADIDHFTIEGVLR